jgi:hypothetical protein
MYAEHAEYTAVISASVEQVFNWLDDQTRLSQHMSKRSWKVGWGKMDARHLNASVLVRAVLRMQSRFVSS